MIPFEWNYPPSSPHHQAGGKVLTRPKHSRFFWRMGVACIIYFWTFMHDLFNFLISSNFPQSWQVFYVYFQLCYILRWILCIQMLYQSLIFLNTKSSFPVRFTLTVLLHSISGIFQAKEVFLFVIRWNLVDRWIWDDLKSMRFIFMICEVIDWLTSSTPICCRWAPLSFNDSVSKPSQA